MSPNKDQDTRNLQLAQFKVSLHERGISENCMNRIFQKLDDVNAKVTPTNYFKLRKPHLLGSTVLHLAYNFEHASGLSSVMSKESDFTIKNQDNLTILHLVLRYQGTNVFRFENLRTTLDNASVNLILSAHLETRNPLNPCDGNRMSHFHIACMANNVKAVNFFLDNGVFIDQAINVDSPYFAGFTGLHLAIRCCNLQVARVLLKRGANIHLKNAKRETASHMVMENYLNFANDDILGYFGSSDTHKKCTNEVIAKLLLEMFSNDNRTIIDDFGLSSLHLACTIIDCSIAAKLAITQNINQSIDTESPLWPGYTALHFAAHVNTKTVQILVNKGADLLAKDAYGMTPIDLCIKTHKTELDIHAILSINPVYKEISLTQRIKLMNLIFAMKDAEEFMTFLDSHPKKTRISIPTNSPLWPGFTPLHLAVLFSTLVHFEDESPKISPKYLQFVSELNNRNSNFIIAQDVHGRTPLHLAFRLGKTDIVKVLIELHEKIDYPADLVDDEGFSLLHVASSRGQLWRQNSDGDLLARKLLLRSKKVVLAYEGKPIRNLVETGWTPLHVAVANGSVNVVELLLEYGADVHVKEVHGVTPVHLLFLRSNTAAKLLLAVTNLRECVVEDIGLSHLHVACYVENADAVKKLLDGGSDVNLRITCDREVIDKSFEFSKLTFYDGYTPLQATSDYWNRFSFDLDFRVIRKRSRTIELLVQHGADIFILNSKGMPFMLERFRDFYTYLKENADIQRQAEVKIGLTKVHVACFFKDWDWLKNLVDEGIDVSGQLSMDLPECGGFTPLHVLMETGNGTYRIESAPEDEFIKLLLDAGADVTVANAKMQTPLHTLYRQCTFTHSGNDVKTLATTMLKAQKDFSINPINAKGISHLHIACNLCETSIVKKFLERCDLDINQPIDYFAFSHKFSVAGFTPLHAAVVRDKSHVSMTSQLETVDLLLEHGADPNRQNSCGETALHLVQHYEIFERIARQGADLNAVNLSGCTPLDSLFSGKASADQISQWLRSGRRFNLFSAVTDEGYIGKTFGCMVFEEFKNLLKVTVVNIPESLKIDEMGRTAIHNIISCGGGRYFYPANDSKVVIFQYASLIEMLATAGCDVDTQDNLGRTALHFAVKFNNLTAIAALLMIGADVNIRDNDGRTALAYHTLPCKSHVSCDESISWWCRVFKALAVHVQRLQICRLEVCPDNRSRVSDKFVNAMNNGSFDSQLQEITNMKIEPYKLALGDFLSGTNVMYDYPSMSQPKKDAIDEFFSQEKISSFREKFGEIAGLLSLQYRKAVMRASLIKEAVSSLNFLANFPVPQLCYRIIFGLLSNADLKNFIASTKNCKDDGQGHKMDIPRGSLLENKKIRIE